ncbi:MAG: hypothetical protein ABSH49_11390 [Bryobacteraceae bacterium]
MLEAASLFQTAAISFSIMVFLEKGSLADQPPQQDPEILCDHPALALVVALDAGIDRRAGDALLFGNAGDGLRLQDLAPGLPFQRVQVDEQPLLVTEVCLLGRRVRRFGKALWKKDRRSTVASSAASGLNGSVQVAENSESQDLKIVFLHEDWLAAPSLSQEGKSGN